MQLRPTSHASRLVSVISTRDAILARLHGDIKISKLNDEHPILATQIAEFVLTTEKFDNDILRLETALLNTVSHLDPFARDFISALQITLRAVVLLQEQKQPPSPTPTDSKTSSSTCSTSRYLEKRTDAATSLLNLRLAFSTVAVGTIHGLQLLLNDVLPDGNPEIDKHATSLLNALETACPAEQYTLVRTSLETLILSQKQLDQAVKMLLESFYLIDEILADFVDRIGELSVKSFALEADDLVVLVVALDKVVAAVLADHIGSTERGEEVSDSQV